MISSGVYEMNRLLELLNISFLMQYGGTCFIWLLLAVSVVYLMITEKKKHIRLIVIWGSLTGILLFMFPLTHYVFNLFLDSPTYYRILWTIPIGIIIAFAGTKAFLKHRLIGLCVCSAVILLTGNKVYRNRYLSISENKYQLPQQMIEICDAIHPRYFEVRACFPEEYIHQVLQYDSSIHLAYGREVLVSGWSDENAFYELEKQENIDVEKLTALCISEQIEYYVARKDKQNTASFSAFGWETYFETNDYYVYRQTEVSSTWEKVKNWLSGLSEDERNAWLDSQNIPRDYE